MAKQTNGLEAVSTAYRLGESLLWRGLVPTTSQYGDDSAGDTPVPISNTEVKPYIADGTWLETAWESR